MTLKSPRPPVPHDRPALVEGPARVGFMVVQADGDAGAGIHEKHGVTALLGAVVGNVTGTRFMAKTRSYH